MLLLSGIFLIVNQLFVEICVSTFTLKVYLLASFKSFKVRVIIFQCF